MCQFLMICNGPEEAHGAPEMGQKSPEAPTRVGVQPTPWAHPLPHGRLGDPPDLFLTPKPLIYTQTSRT